MKKTVSLLLTMAIALGAFGFVGCKKAEVTEKSTVVFADFEQWAPDFQLMRPMSNFGVVSVNEDPAFVRSGNASAKLQPMGGYRDSVASFSYNQSVKPYVYFPLKSDLFSYDYQNLRLLDRITLQLYNAQTEEKTVKIGFVSEIVTIDEAMLSEGTDYTLQSGWNTIVYHIDYHMLSMILDIEKAAGLYLQFEKAGTREAKDAPTYYLDDIEFSVRRTPVEIGEIPLRSGEICDFEQRYQEFIMLTSVRADKDRPYVSVVRAADEGLARAASGERVLKVVFRAGEANDEWPMLIMPQYVVRKSGYMNIPQEEWSKYVFRFDLFMRDEIESALCFEHFTSNTKYTARVADHLMAGEQFDVGRWITFEQSFEDFEATPNVIEDPTYLRLAWPNNGAAKDRTFYFDNFRYEKIAE